MIFGKISCTASSTSLIDRKMELARFSFQTYTRFTRLFIAYLSVVEFVDREIKQALLYTV